MQFCKYITKIIYKAFYQYSWNKKYFPFLDSKFKWSSPNNEHTIIKNHALLAAQKPLAVVTVALCAQTHPLCLRWI